MAMASRCERTPSASFASVRFGHAPELHQRESVVTTGAAIPAGSATIYLVRHGRTALNAEGALRGHLDPPLDETGWREARAIAGVLAPLEPRRIVSSPLRRALETARCIADRCGIGVDIGERLIDRDYGQWAGRSPEQVSREWGRIADAPGVESEDSVLRASA